MRKLSKKMMISLMTFALCFIALGASTFAWFTLATENTVDNITLGVTAGAGMEISLDYKNDGTTEWSANLNPEDIMTKIIALNSGENLLKLDAVTSNDGKEFYYDEPKNYRTSAPNNFGTNVTNTNNNKSFIYLPIYFRTVRSLETVTIGQGHIPSVYLHNYNNSVTYQDVIDNASVAKSGTYLVSKGVNFTSGLAYKGLNYTTSYVPNGTVTDNPDILGTDHVKYYAANAARISFIAPTFTWNNTANTTVENSDYALTLGTVTDTTPAKIFDFSTIREYGYGYSAGGFASFYANKSGITLQFPTWPGTVTIQNKGSLSSEGEGTGISSNDNSKICEMKQVPDRTGSDTVYVGVTYLCLWLEGWDADCFDAIFEDELKVQLEFKMMYRYATA